MPFLGYIGKISPSLATEIIYLKRVVFPVIGGFREHFRKISVGKAQKCFAEEKASQIL